MSAALGPEILAAGKAIGLLRADGSPNTTWFEGPLGALQHILTSDPQRTALFDLLNQVLPPETVAGAPADERWHPLLGPLEDGNLYVTLRGGSLVGLAGLVHGGGTAEAPRATLRVQLPLVIAGTTTQAVLGDATHPLAIDLRVRVAWTAPAKPISLAAVRVIATLPLAAGAAPSIAVVLEQLALGAGEAARDVKLDGAALEAEAVHLLLSLLKAVSDTGTTAVNALLGLLGLDGSLPAFPIVELLDGPAPLRRWLTALLDGGAMITWLGHLAALLGVSAAVVPGADGASWSLPVLAVGSGPGLGLRVGRAAGRFELGVALSAAPSASMRLEATATLAALPLAGAGAASLLPEAMLALRAPGDGGVLVVPTTVAGEALAVGSLRAGVRWDGAKLLPLIELTDVTLGGAAPYRRLDLSSADAVIGAVSSQAATLLKQALGETGAGRELAALAGLVAPDGAASWPYLADLPSLVANPSRAIAGCHRAALAAGAWQPLFGALGRLLGLTGAVAGDGTPDRPWRLDLGLGDAPALALVAWNARAGSAPEQLRVGLCAASPPAPWTWSWTAEILAVDLPASGAATIAVLAGQHARIALTSLPEVPASSGIAIAAGSIEGRIDVVAGASMTASVAVTDLVVGAGGATVAFPTLRFPSAGGLALPSRDAERVLCWMLARAADTWGGQAGAAVPPLFGLRAPLGRTAGWPLLGDGAGRLVDDTYGALREWLGRAATALDAGGSPVLPAALGELQGLLGGGVPASLRGAGTYDDPWALPLSPTASLAETLAWLEPEGPPAAWAMALSARATAAASFAGLLGAAREAAAFAPYLGDALAASDPGTLTASLEALAGHLATSDGMVPLAAQRPADEGSFTEGTALHVAHAGLPRDAGAIAQILAQVDAWAGGAGKPRSVLLVGPAFADRAAWGALLTAAGAVASHLDFRLPGVAPSAVDLGGVAAADWYTADLTDDGSGALAPLTAQLGRAVTRIQALRAGVPVTIVAWSTAGLAARAFVHDTPAGIAGLVALGVPFGPTPLVPLRVASAAAGVRLVAALTPALPAGPLGDALAHLVAALDGWLPAASAGGLPVRASYPIGAFTDASTSTGTSGVPLHVLASTLDGAAEGPTHLFALVQQGLAQALAGAATRKAPTHLAFGVRAALPVPAAGAGMAAASVMVRADAFRLALADGAADPPRAEHRVAVRATLERPLGWLVGSAGDTADGGVRVRRIELGADVVPAAAGSVVTPVLRLHQAALRGPTRARVQLGEAEAAGLLGEVFHAVGSAAPPPVAALLDALVAMGIATADPSGAIGVAADALSAIAADARAFLEPALARGLAAKGGLCGFSGPTGGPWTLALAGLPLQLTLARDPWTLGLRTQGAGLPLADAALTFSAALPLPGAASLDGRIALGDLMLSFGAGKLAVAVAGWLDALTLRPSPGAAAIKAAVTDLVPRLLVSGAVGGILDGLFGEDFRSGPVDRLLSAPGSTLARPGAVGRSDGSGALDPARLAALLSALALAVSGGPDLKLPGGLAVTLSGNGSDADPLTLRLATTAKLLGVVTLDMRVAIDRLRHLTPSGTVSFDLALAAGSTWGSVSVAIGVGPAGPIVTITPSSGTAVQILPVWSGLGSLTASLERLLPTLLDRLVGALGTTGTPGLVLAVADALALRDPVTKRFDGDKLSGLPTRWLTDLGAAFPGAMAALMNGVGMPGAATPAGSKLTWSCPAGASSGSRASITLGWDGAPLAVIGADLDAGACTLHVEAGRKGGATVATASAGLSLASVGLDVTPAIALTATPSGFDARLLPLGELVGGGPVLHLTPATPVLELGGDGLTPILQRWVLPLAGQLALTAASDSLGLTIGGATVRDLLGDAGILASSGRLAAPLPSPDRMAARFLGALVARALASGAALTPTLRLAFVSDGAAGFGLRVSGHQDVDAGAVTISLLCGDPWSAGADAGLSLYLFKPDPVTSGAFLFTPRLHVAGCGVGLAASGDHPLVDTDFLRIGGVSGYLFFDLALAGAVSVSELGAGVAVRDFGLPLGQALGGNKGGDNPVAAGLLQSAGGAPGGDPHPVNPSLDLAAWYDGSFHLKLHTADEGAAFWLPVHRGFGPIYIDRIGLEPTDDPGLELLVDGSVKVAGLTVQLDELGVEVPFAHTLAPDRWSLDLRGLGLSFEAPGVSIAGGLRKSGIAPVEYDGILSIDLAGRGFTAAGGYSRPEVDGDRFTSLFIFVSLPMVIGGPPFLFITGLGGGAGYNRALHPPEDITAVPAFPLVSAIDDDALANDPMGALVSMGQIMPARRGSMWLAAGIRFTSFGLVHSTVLVYVALDGGFELGVLGVSRMVLPTDDLALVSVELALKARFSTREGLLSIQAQLTDNSWLLSRDCQLTGGFAFFVWFDEGQFLLTLGGYHPAFQSRPEFPVVPRLGYHWNVFGALVIKGESYFALTNSAVMAGASFDATFEAGPIRVWFDTHTDFLIQWDPFAYAAGLGISVGASFTIDLCFPFVGCASISITVSIGADLEIAGPPLHGVVKVDLAVASLTIPFGADNVAQDPLEWGPFADKYLFVGDPARSGQGLRVTEGLLPPSPPGAQPAPGSADQPWKLAVEMAFLTETRMAASAWRGFTTADDVVVPYLKVDIAPMQRVDVPSAHFLRLERHERKRGWFELPDDDDGATEALGILHLAKHFEIKPVMGKVPEGLWRYHREGPAAAANTVPAVVGLTVKGSAILEGKSALIPIGTLVEDSADLTLPLPLRPPQEVLDRVRGFGSEAAALIAALDLGHAAKSAAKVLAQGGAFDRVRADSGLPAAGLSAFSLRSLASRSSPPRLAPLSTGLTMEAVGLPAPAAVTKRALDKPVRLTAPRLRAVLQGPPPPTADAPPAPRTTVRAIAPAQAAPRRAPPRPVATPGARLERVAPPTAPRPTTAARAGRTLRHPEVGFGLSAAAALAFQSAADDFAGEGVAVPAGTSHVWELPAAEGAIGVQGAAVRLTWLSGGGTLLRDEELLAEQEVQVPVPAGSAQVVVTCLGVPPAGLDAALGRGLGAVSAALAPAGRRAITGWQLGNQVAQVGAAVMLGRGACVVAARGQRARRDGHPTAQAMVRLDEALVEQRAVETWLPPDTEVVLLLLDQLDPAAADAGDLEVRAEGATLADPVRVARGRRVALIFDVGARAQGAAALVVAAGSARAYRIAGVIGAGGRAVEVAARLRGGAPDQMVPDGPLTPHGEVRVRLSQGATP